MWGVIQEILGAHPFHPFSKAEIFCLGEKLRGLVIKVLVEDEWWGLRFRLWMPCWFEDGMYGLFLVVYQCTNEDRGFMNKSIIFVIDLT